MTELTQRDICAHRAILESFPGKSTFSASMALATGDADLIRRLISSSAIHPPTTDNGVFRGRAVALIGIVAPVLVWMRVYKATPINVASIARSLQIASISSLAENNVFLHRDEETGGVERIHVPDMPSDLTRPLLAYLWDLPGYDSTIPFAEQRSDKPMVQHGFALMCFFAPLQMSISAALGRDADAGTASEAS